MGNLKILHKGYSVFCNRLHRNVTVYIRYGVLDGKLQVYEPQGCDEEFHKCNECDKCVTDCLARFLQDFQ